MVVFILILVTKNKSMTDGKKSIDKRKDNATYEIRKRTEKKISLCVECFKSL